MYTRVLFGHFFVVVFHDYKVKLLETSQLHVLWRKCRKCSGPLFFHCRSFFIMVAANISHFLTAATSFSCCSSNKKCFLQQIKRTIFLLIAIIIRNVISLALTDINQFLQVVVFVVLELAQVLWYLSCGCAQANLFPYNSKPVAMLAIRYTIETLPVS